MPGLHWDLFCRVIDNHGDAGVCWRLARALARRGQVVRLWIDDPAPLAWMAPGGAPGVTVLPWTDPPPDAEPGDVVVETFGCEPPDTFVARMARRTPPPRWINLEYLSAEPYVERSHGLPSPLASGPGAGLVRWFFYPGFTPATGGLLLDDDTGGRIAARAWARQQGWLAADAQGDAEWSVLVFTYDNPALPGLLQALAGRRLRLLVPPGPARASLDRVPGLPRHRRIDLPWLPQVDFDRLLAATDLNLVRGEDSFVRAQRVADAPFLWHIYPQADGAHAAKLQAFLSRYTAAAAPALAETVRNAFLRFNGLDAGHPKGAAGSAWALPEAGPWQALHRSWRTGLAAQDDLCQQLMRFVKASLP